MTAQIPDSVNYRGTIHTIAGKNGTGLFDPAAHEMKPIAMSSACWRGFICGYAIEGGALLLDALEIGLDEPAPILFGVPPELHDWGNQRSHAFYRRLNHRVPYTGGLLLARDFIQDLYVHMGFHPAWKYREVHELAFREGALVEETDRSVQIAELRRELANRPLEPDGKDKSDDIKRWIEKCFSQDYGW